ncbi:MAG: hypothetical protein QMB24_05230 [Spirosomataceae bacterium]|jgi:hypothetical protein
MTIKNGLPSLICTFDVKLADHKIDISTIVVAKIAEIIEVKVSWYLRKYKERVHLNSCRNEDLPIITHHGFNYILFK